MKTNNVILISVALFLLCFLIVFLVIFRKSIDIVHEREAKQHKFKKVAVDRFDKLVISSNWNVYIQQGSNYLVDIEEKGDSLLKSSVSNNNGCLYLSVDTTLARNTNTLIKARITLPFLNYLKAGKGTHVKIENYTSDSMEVVLENGCVLTGAGNTINKVSYKVKGDAELNFTSIIF